MPLKDRVKRAAYTKEYRAKNAEHIAARVRKNYIANRASILEYAARYRAEHREATLAASRAYYAENRGALVEYQRRYRIEHRDKILARNKTDRRRALSVIHTANRRAKRRVSDAGTITMHMLARSRRTIPCYWCGQPTKSITDRHVDHVIPLSKGGLNISYNLCIACKSCNLHKSSKHPNEFSKQGVLF